MIRSLPHIAQMASYQLADLSAAADIRTIQLAQNECFRPPSPKALETGAKALGASNLYPDPDWTILRETIARIHSLPAAGIVCGNGSLDLL